MEEDGQARRGDAATYFGDRFHLPEKRVNGDRSFTRKWEQTKRTTKVEKRKIVHIGFGRGQNKRWITLEDGY